MASEPRGSEIDAVLHDVSVRQHGQWRELIDGVVALRDRAPAASSPLYAELDALVSRLSGLAR